MKRHIIHPARRGRFVPLAATLLATLAASPGHAITIPNLPLQTGTAYPPANVMFILDDSGSMVFEKMPDDESGTLANDPDDKSYVNNTIYYNPSETYLAWMTASGQRLTGGTSYTSAYANLSLASDAIDLSSSSSCKTVDRNGSNRTVCGGTQTFFVPKSGATDYGDNSSFYRYQILNVPNDGYSTPRVIRSEWVEGAGDTSASWSNKDINKNSSRTDSISVPDGATNLVITIANGSGGNADLYVKRGSAPTTSSYDYADTGSGNYESVTIPNPAAGTWYILTVNSGSSKINNEDISASFDVDLDEGMADAGCEDDESKDGWRNCTAVTPTGRSEADEMTNFATWFSYHRTRIKVAKAGASEAFGQLGSGIRVGYDSIWNRDKNDYHTTTVGSSPAFPIPVGDDDGLFRGDNRTDWFAELQGARGYTGTPLKGALQRSGRYFENTASDGPWGPGSTDQLSCRQNFAILTTDGYWNDNSGYTNVGDSDATEGSLIVSEDGKSSAKYKPVTPYVDNFKSSNGTLYSKSNTLADVANYYWKRDLVDDLANDVPTSSADPAFWQHMVTFGVSIGLQGRLNPKTDIQSITNGSKNWGDPTDSEDLDRIDDLWHASVNGHGNFVTATNPTEFVDGLVAALATVAQRLGSASNVTANSTSFQTDTRVYQASYVSGKWTGELAAFEVSSAGVSNKDTDGDGVRDSVWKASEHIPAFGERNILTSSATGAGHGATFPTASQVSAMDLSSRVDVNGGPTTGQQSADYIAGSQELEKANGGKLRDRDSLLGDIANSSPTYIKATESIYVGANDGMMHAFNALTGAELFAYVPAGIDFGNLATLSDPQYSPNHRYFVDGPVVASTTQTPGKNYVVGSLGRGGKGVFALDVTDPANFGAADVAWDLTGSALGDDMGQVIGEPLVAKLNNGDAAVIVPNGINSTNGHSVLYVIDIEDGTVIRKFDTGEGDDNGMSAPRGADTDGDGVVDYVYAGDLNGNLWKFDFSSSDADDWTIANSGDPMFVAKDADGNRQPISAGLAIARDPSTHKVWIYAGTGRFMTTGDVSSTSTQSIYGLIDGNASISSRDELVGRAIEVSSTLAGRDVRSFESASGLPAGKKGWYIDLGAPTPGERVVSNPVISGSVVLVASIIPPQENTCAAGGKGYLNAIDPFTGGALSETYFDVDSNGDFDDDDKITEGGESHVVSSVGVDGMLTLPTFIEDVIVYGTSKGDLGNEKSKDSGMSARRISWREIRRD
jgi:type IV pilus assembly protein PilY1